MSHIGPRGEKICCGQAILDGKMDSGQTDHYRAPTEWDPNYLLNQMNNTENENLVKLFLNGRLRLCTFLNHLQRESLFKIYLDFNHTGFNNSICVVKNKKSYP